MIIAPGMSGQEDQVTLVNDLVAIAGTTRKDCVVVASPNRAAVVANRMIQSLRHWQQLISSVLHLTYFVDNNYSASV